MTEISNARLTAAIEEIVGERKILLAVHHGSRLYGVSGPDSDIDIKIVFLPTVDEILLGHVDFAIDGNPDSHLMRARDIDIQAFSLLRYIDMLARFEHPAVEMLFAASNAPFVLAKDDAFREIEAKAPLLIGRGRLSLTSHARANLGRFSPDHAEHIAELDTILDLLRKHPAQGRLRDHPDLVTSLAGRNRCGLALHRRSGEKLKNGQVPAHIVAEGGEPNATLFVNLRGRLIDVGQSIEAAMLDIETLRKDVSRKRAKAERLGDLDPKPIYHALRLLSQTREYHDNGGLSFPRPDADLLLAIREGRYSEDEISQIAKRYFAMVDCLEGFDFRAPQDIDRSHGLQLVKKFHLASISGPTQETRTA